MRSLRKIVVINVFLNKSKTDNFTTIKTPPSGSHTVIYVLASTNSERGGYLQLNTSFSCCWWPRRGQWGCGVQGLVPLTSCGSVHRGAEFGLAKRAASYNSPIIFGSCLIDGYSLVLPLRRRLLYLWHTSRCQ